jgi:general secretion pathway protein F
MATANPSAGHTLSLEQLIALGEEIAALARAGVPLDEGLAELGRELPGRLGKVARQMGGQRRDGFYAAVARLR